MVQSNQLWIALAALAVGGSVGVATPADAQGAAPGARPVWVADYSGRPPFKRRALTTEAFAERARAEGLQAQAFTPGERVRVVRAQGRPPFERRFVDAASVVEFARFEEVSKPSDRRRHIGPPGKGHMRR